LKKGQDIVAQVTKDGIGTKGPTLTTYLSLPGRYLVLMPGLERRGVSRKIEDVKERERLKKVLTQLDVRDELGFIVRTAGVGQGARALQKDYRYLTRLWDRVEQKAFDGRTGDLLYRESDLVIRTIRDIYGPDMGDIIIDDEDVARRARDFLAMVMPKAVNRVKLYNGERPLFHAYGIEEEIGRLFMHRVELLSGGSLVIEQTEALVAIDVNSGRFREEGDLEETAYKINIEAAAAIARQLRLRDLGGVIVVDFIDMRSEKRRRAVERAFRAALKSDRARIKVARMSPFGVIELTRQRVRPSLRQSIFQRCPACRGAGYVATQETLELNLVRQLKLYLVRRNQGVEVYLNQANMEYLINRKRHALALLEEQSGKTIVVRLEPELPDDEFRIIPLDARSN
ncbi:MAG: Rne/Rng family ribonuclease, partial [Planctomycetes bacterium]|nr:Rne/Rng family ribonuclease [Planctomycetota bacterium]